MMKKENPIPFNPGYSLPAGVVIEMAESLQSIFDEILRLDATDDADQRIAGLARQSLEYWQQRLERKDND